MKYYIYKDVSDFFRWQLLASNGEILAESGDGYVTENDCRKMINIIKKSDNVSVEISTVKYIKKSGQ